MTALLLVPLLLPFLAPRLARRTFDRLAPDTALWVVTASALALAGACVAALGALVLTGLLKFPAFAALGEPRPPPAHSLGLPRPARRGGGHRSAHPRRLDPRALGLPADACLPYGSNAG